MHKIRVLPKYGRSLLSWRLLHRTIGCFCLRWVGSFPRDWVAVHYLKTKANLKMSLSDELYRVHEYYTCILLYIVVNLQIIIVLTMRGLFWHVVEVRRRGVFERKYGGQDFPKDRQMEGLMDRKMKEILWVLSKEVKREMEEREGW